MNMRILALAGVALALSACGGGNDATSANGANAFSDENLMMDENMMMDGNASMNGMGGMDANMSTNASTENMMMNDMTTNDPDTNLANGL
jgi:hypothetical protein